MSVPMSRESREPSTPPLTNHRGPGAAGGGFLEVPLTSHGGAADTSNTSCRAPLVAIDSLDSSDYAVVNELLDENYTAVDAPATNAANDGTKPSPNGPTDTLSLKSVKSAGSGSTHSGDSKKSKVSVRRRRCSGSAVPAPGKARSAVSLSAATTGRA